MYDKDTKSKNKMVIMVVVHSYSTSIAHTKVFDVSIVVYIHIERERLTSMQTRYTMYVHTI